MSAGSNSWVPVTIGMTLHSGDTIKCGNGHAEITFFEGSTVELLASTQVLLSELGISDAGSTTIHLKQQIGKTISRVNKLVDTASSYEMETPAAVAAVRGSTMTVTVAEDGSTIVGNQGGDIRVISQGVEVTIPEGMQSSVSAGEVPGEPEPIGTEPAPSPTPTPTPTSAPSPGPVYFASVTTGLQADRAEAFIGETITYTYWVSNTGNIQIQSVSLTDNVTGIPAFQSGDNNANSYLDPGEIWTYTATHIATAADPSPLLNTATFTVTVSGTTLVAEDHASVIILPPVVTIVITSPSDGETVNTHTITVTGTVSDLTITEATIANNGNSHTIPVSEGSFSTGENVNNGENIITVTVTYGEGQTASDTVTINVETATYGIRVELTWDTGSTDVDSHLIRPGSSYGNIPGDCYYRNTNPDWGLPEVQEDNPSLDQDDTDGYGPENITLQQPYEEGIYQYKAHYYSDHGHGSTNATVRVWINDEKVLEDSRVIQNHEVWDCAYIEWPSGNIIVPAPAISLTKTADPLTVHVGDNVTYNYGVANTGNVPLESVTVSDDHLEVLTFISGDTNENSILDVSETWVYSANYTINAEDTSPLVNTATASGTDFLSQMVTDEASASVSILIPALSLTKTADPLTVHVGDNVTYTYQVTNAGNTPLSDITLTDDWLGILTLFSGDANENGLLESAETWVCSANYTIGSEDPNPLVNIATASGTDFLSQTVTAEESASVIILIPGISLAKTWALEPPDEEVNVGDNITYTYTVTNTGNTPLLVVSVTDDLLGPVTTPVSGDTNENGLLDVTETWVYSANYTINAEDPSPLVNIATASGTDFLSQTVTAEASASVTIEYIE